MVAALDGLGELVAGVVVLEGRVHTRAGGAVDDDKPDERVTVKEWTLGSTWRKATARA